MTQVVFYAGNTVIGSFTNTPSNVYSLTWTNVVAGSYSLTFVATESRGAMSTSAPVNITVTATPTDTTPPTVVITNPGTGQTVGTPSLTVSGTATDDVGVTAVEVRVNGGMFQTATGTTTWTQSVTLNQGSNTIEARSKDAAGNFSIIATVMVTSSVTQMPLRVSSISLQANNQFQFVIAGPAGGSVGIEVSSNLSTWTPLTNLTLNGGTVTFVETVAPALKRRFYRVNAK